MKPSASLWLADGAAHARAAGERTREAESGEKKTCCFEILSSMYRARRFARSRKTEAHCEEPDGGERGQLKNLRKNNLGLPMASKKVAADWKALEKI